MCDERKKKKTIKKIESNRKQKKKYVEKVRHFKLHLAKCYALCLYLSSSNALKKVNLLRFHLPAKYIYIYISDWIKKEKWTAAIECKAVHIDFAHRHRSAPILRSTHTPHTASMQTYSENLVQGNISKTEWWLNWWCAHCSRWLRR